MKIADLKKLIADLPDDMEVVVSGSDHSFHKAGRGTGVVKSELHGKSEHMSHYWGENNKSNPDHPVIEVFWIDDGRY
jgi:hypothetical protein